CDGSERADTEPAAAVPDAITTHARNVSAAAAVWRAFVTSIARNHWYRRTAHVPAVNRAALWLDGAPVAIRVHRDATGTYAVQTGLCRRIPNAPERISRRASGRPGW